MPARCGSVRCRWSKFAYGPLGHNVHYGAVHNPVACRSRHRRFIVGFGLGRRGAFDFAALGSDTGGSIRLPAHFCGVSGLKTTVGLVSRAGAMPLSQSLDTVGPLARTVEDCALLTGLMAGADPLDPTTSTRPVPDYMAATCASAKGMTVGIPKAFYVDDLDADTAAILQNTIATLKDEGVKIVEVDLPNQGQLTAACQFVLATEAAAMHKRWMIERPQDYGAQVLMRLQNGLAITGVSYIEALRWRGPALAAYLAAVKALTRCWHRSRPGRLHHCRDRCVTVRRRRDSACDRASRADQLSRSARSLDLGGLHQVETSRSGMQLIGRPFDEATLLTMAPPSSVPPISTNSARSWHEQSCRGSQSQRPVRRRTHRPMQ